MKQRGSVTHAMEHTAAPTEIFEGRALQRRMRSLTMCHWHSADGRSNIIVVGQQRFRILEVVREAPFVSAMISWMKISDENIIF